MHYEGVPVFSYYVTAEFASVQIIFGATVSAKQFWQFGMSNAACSSIHIGFPNQCPVIFQSQKAALI